MDSVPDPVFSAGLFGPGIAVDPTEGVLLAPCDSVVTHLAKTGHAVTLTTPSGVEVLLHIGIDTVALKGEGFTAKIAQGTHVSTGDVLIEFDLDFVAQRAKSLVSVIVIANGEAFEAVEITAQERVKAGESPLLHIQPKHLPVSGKAETQAGGDSLQVQVTLGCKGGLHARPAARARNAAAAFDAKLELVFAGRRAPLNSVVGLLGLGAGEGSTVEIVATGTQARAALDAVKKELESAAPEENEKPTQKKPAPLADVPVIPGCFSGVCASSGIAVGCLQHWEVSEIEVPEAAAGFVSAEMHLLTQAVEKVDSELAEAVRHASGGNGDPAAGIFAVHRMLLEDPLLIGEAQKAIQHGKSAGFAWRKAVQGQIATLSALEDALLAERASDLRDLEKRVLLALGYFSAHRPAMPNETVLCATEFTPSDLTGLDRNVIALVMAHGGTTSHAAILARQLGLPCLVAVGDGLHELKQGSAVVLNASAGYLHFAPSSMEIKQARQEAGLLQQQRETNLAAAFSGAQTTDGRMIEVSANIATLADASMAVQNGADGVGLLRTELLFIHRPQPPTVAEHRETYQAILDALKGRVATIRTLDVGADKEVDYLTLPPEPNPALGLRGIRMAQVLPHLLDDQLRGLLAVKPSGAVRVLLPMVTDAGEMASLQAHIKALADEIGRKDTIEVGAMIEVPSAALMADQLAPHVDFFSIGTNDLTQYALAMDRCHTSLAKQADGLHPAVLRLIDMTVRGAEKYDRPVSVCGALAGDLMAVPLLIGLGIAKLSVDPPLVPEIKACIRKLDYVQCRNLALDALDLDSAKAVRASIATFCSLTSEKMEETCR